MVADTLSTIVVGAAVYIVCAVILFALLLVGSEADEEIEEWERRSAGAPSPTSSKRSGAIPGGNHDRRPPAE